MGPSDDDQDHHQASVNLDQLLEQRERIEAMIRAKFTRIITIMFTDLKGSTQLAESHGDVVTRLLIKRHNDILFPAIAQYGGVLVKTMGDGSLSYFAEAADAVRAAVQVQRGLRQLNCVQPDGAQLLMRVGINTGTGIVEKDDLFGDAVNVASRFENLAEPGEILISESTCEALAAARGEFGIRLKMTTVLKEKSGLFKAFKVYLSAEEMAAEAPAAGEPRVVGRRLTDRMLPPRPAPPPPAASAEERARLERGRALESEGELVQLLLLCDASPGPGPLAELAQALQARMAREQPLECRFQGESALWFHKDALVIGRTPEADLPLTNQAISRVPLRFSVADGAAAFAVPSRGAPFKPIEIEQEGERVPVRPDTEQRLGPQGRVVLSGCFPIEWRFWERRFLALRILDPTQDLKRVYPGPLRDIWRGFEQESRSVLLVGR